jgi:hypothetical protein
MRLTSSILYTIQQPHPNRKYTRTRKDDPLESTNLRNDSRSRDERENLNENEGEESNTGTGSGSVIDCLIPYGEVRYGDHWV